MAAWARGIESECVLFYTYADMRKHEYFIDKIEDESQRRIAMGKVEDVIDSPAFRHADTSIF